MRSTAHGAVSRVRAKPNPAAAFSEVMLRREGGAGYVAPANASVVLIQLRLLSGRSS